MLQDKSLLREFLFRDHKAHTMDYNTKLLLFLSLFLFIFASVGRDSSSLTTIPVIPILCHFTILSDYQENLQILYCNVQSQFEMDYCIIDISTPPWLRK